MYEINNLTFRYMLSDRNSLEQVSLKIKKGKITLIAGPSGSGKTTLLRHLKKELLPKGERLAVCKRSWVFISESISPDGNGYRMA